MDRVLDRFLFDEGTQMKNCPIRYTPFKELPELNGWELGWLRKRVRECGDKAIILIHPGHLSLHTYEAILSPKRFEEVAPVHERYMKTLKRLIKNRKAPMVVLEEDDCVGHTAIDLEEIFGLNPKKDKDIYFVRTRNKQPTPIVGWDDFHSKLDIVGVKEAFVGGQTLTVTDGKTEKDMLEQELRSEKRITPGVFENEIRLSEKAKNRAIEESHEVERNMLSKVRDNEGRKRIRKGMQTKRRSLGEDAHMRKCVGDLANQLQSRGMHVRVMPMVTSPERPPRRRSKSRP